MPRKYTYGPFQSRRLGLSLGVDVLQKPKICTYNCVYCEIGVTDKLVSPEYRFSAPPSHRFGKELKDILNFFPKLNHISFGYNGEPTLNKNLLDFLKVAKDVRNELRWDGKKPILTLFTNSSTLHFDEIREKVKQFELVLAKIDVGLEDSFKRINRPHYKTPKLEELINAIVKLKHEMPPKHKLAIQCLIVNSYEKDFIANNTQKNIIEIARALKRIKPDFVQIYSTDRIPAEYFVYGLSEERLKEIEIIFKLNVNDKNVDIRSY